MALVLGDLELMDPATSGGDAAPSVAWKYVTSDSTSATFDAGYWDGAQGLLRPGDVLAVRASDGGRVYRVASWSGSQVSLQRVAEDVDQFIWEP